VGNGYIQFDVEECFFQKIYSFLSDNPVMDKIHGHWHVLVEYHLFFICEVVNIK